MADRRGVARTVYLAEHLLMNVDRHVSLAVYGVGGGKKERRFHPLLTKYQKVFCFFFSKKKRFPYSP